MTSDVQFRRYDPDDKNVVWLVHDRAFRHSALQFYPELNRYLRDIPTHFLETGGEFLVGTVEAPPADPVDYGQPGERVVAVGGYVPGREDPAGLVQTGPFDLDDRTIAVKSVRVDPAFQRQGFGRALMAELETRARAERFERAVLDTGGAMEAAQSMYESLGYERAGQETIGGFQLIYYEKDL